MIGIVLACYALLTLLMLMPAILTSRRITGIGGILLMFLLWVWFAAMATLPFVLL